jgi:geranylgeranyl pyrophosphate synthase
MVAHDPRPETADAAESYEAVKERIYSPVAGELEQVVLNIASVAAGRGEGPQAPEIEARLAHVLSSPGKRVRPAITLLASRLWGRPADGRAINMATAVELLHIASLIHDDTVDSAETRRGRATASNLWGGAVAVQLGDYVFASSAIFVCETNSVRLIKRFAQTIAELSRGELHEALTAWRPAVGRDGYFQRIFDKTASLFATAAESGAVLGEADEDHVELLREYGRNLGMAYQVYDDLLDFESTSEELGKPAEHDLPSGVLTLPAIIALEGGTARQPVLDYLEAPARQRARLLPATVAAIRLSGALAEAKAFASRFTSQATAALRPLPASHELDCLNALTDYLLLRRS